MDDSVDFLDYDNKTDMELLGLDVGDNLDNNIQAADGSPEANIADEVVTEDANKNRDDSTAHVEREVSALEIVKTDQPCSSGSLKRTHGPAVEQSPPKLGKGDSGVAVIPDREVAVAAEPRDAVEAVGNQIPAPAPPQALPPVGPAVRVLPPIRPAVVAPRRNTRPCVFCSRNCWSAGCTYVTSRMERIQILDDSGVCLRCLARHPGRRCLSSHKCRVCQSVSHHQAVCAAAENRRRPSD